MWENVCLVTRNCPSGNRLPRRGAAADKNRADWAFGRHVSFDITDRLDVFRQQLRELGYSEGKDLAFEERWADRKLDRLDDLVSELIERKIEAEEFRRSCSPAKLQRLYFHEF